MNHRMNFLAAVACVAVLTGCDWGGVSDDESWNDAYSWLNFSGTYSLSDGGLIGNPGEGTGRGSVSQSYPSGSSGTLQDSIPAMGGRIGSGVVPGSVMIVIHGEGGNLSRAVVDDKHGKLVDSDGTDPLSGTFSYSSGVWFVKGLTGFDGGPVSATVSFAYYFSGTSGMDTGVAVSFLHVTQQGNKLTMRDSQGNEYSGRMTSASVPRDGFIREMEVRMSFEVQSATGIKIVGNFSGKWSGATSAETGVLDNRVITATISYGSGHDDIQGTASAVTAQKPARGPSTDDQDDNP